MGSHSSAKIPVVDFSKENLNPGSSSWSATCKDVLLALEEFGCFIAVYDKVPSELQNKLFSALEELFNLPTETKMQNAHNKPYHGYVGQHSQLPLHESIGIDNATTLEGIQSFANLMWPAGNDHFCEITREFSKIALELDHLVTKMIFESYGVGKYSDSHLEPMSYLLRNQVKGLEVETKDGEWISLELSPSSFAVIAGDALVAWSNGRLHSPYHKVMMSGNEERYSLGLFQFSSG
ncbi:putative 2-oxoglutarate-dependent dioxygenase AOP1.2 [Vitis vinifera]|uniref:Putative 2-oxoglutarate-dependent dioxygenase AOP1.2 n=1 Tax=Vitis vinifera TaxID=29760 RepID=A0A438D0H5_VITVI|nr:putative 2-oxoglutarate-dependent dioxygenase AOP1.2 [Vitis vinifera]